MTQTRQLFGTDGIRGVAGEFPLTPDSVYWIGRALGHDLVRVNAKPRVLIGQDTRISSRWIADRFLQGLASVGVATRSAGVITTPGVAFLARSQGFDAGVVISASHNPWTDNGIKIFSRDGYKLPDARELAIEKEIFALLQDSSAAPAADSTSGSTSEASSLPGDESLRQAYVRWLAGSVSADLSRLRVVVDTANGAAAAEAPALFRAVRVSTTFLHSAPDGQNINDNCGALHPETVAHFVAESVASGKQEERFDVGVTFDGDADRAIFVSKAGKIVDGDAVLLVTARSMMAQGRLCSDTVVSTVMSNLGLEKALAAGGIRMVRTPVGDKYVLEEMVRLDAALGGEQSGHVIFREYSTTGDGLLTALRLFEIARLAGVGLDELTADLFIYPQRLVNVRVRDKKGLQEMPAIAQEIRRVEDALAGTGRVLVRFSGTEPLARVMVEGPDLEQVESFSLSMAEAIRGEMGE